ncbi:MAG: pyridoxine 5'-phosphate synthase [Alphaproteobacteria bacterium]|jgi:pyridoxine 5-phosphate synthase|nr:pyridoxine 5'-phosphate synthase [Alphaproteobacteria bacterium]
MKRILGFNVDHIATLRNARGEGFPNLIDLAQKSITYGADQITAHLREDRRHIKDEDIINLKKYINKPLNMEMALTNEMIEIATKKVIPHSVCLVPEKREEITTEGGLNLIPIYNELEQAIELFHKHNIKVSLFIDIAEEQINAAINLKPDSIEINTGIYSNLPVDSQYEESLKIKQQAQKVFKQNIAVHAGHGLNLANLKHISNIAEVREFNIGHFIIGYALEFGLKKAIEDIKKSINNENL